jgi:hypothetical protein
MMVPMLESFTRATFAPLVGDRFELVLDGSEVTGLTLTEVDEPYAGSNERAGAGVGRSPFSIVFRGPLEPVLPQRIYTFRNERLGSFELFIVPIGRDDGGMRYEAVFS